MRVALVCLSSTPGILAYTKIIANGLINEVRVTMYVPRGQIEHPLDSRLDVRPILNPLPPRSLAAVADIRTFCLLCGSLRKGNYDIIHFTCAHPWNVPLSYFLDRKRIVLTLHDPEPHPGEGITSRIVAVYNALIVRRVGRLVVHGKVWKQLLESRGLHHVSYAPLASTQVQSPSPYPIDGPILFFGRIMPYKGLDIFVDSLEIVMREEPTVHAVIAGEGRIPEKVASKLAHLAPRVTVLNRRISEDEKDQLFRVTRFVVLPYRQATQSGVIPDAYAHGRPVLATTVGALPEAVVDGQTGFLVPPDEPEALASKMRLLLEHPELAQKMGNSAREFFERELSPQRMVQSLVETYKIVEGERTTH
ncbi:MAG: glycosyltransferase family 4 protein [Symbiobacterium sp.]|uniref:glycosyltransferase family 4 protein n=1 Tax=Symbiobacterium sp. TaxID=1971213 RepID=UPI0034647EB7